MVSKKVKVVNPSGLHLRPAGVLSQTAMKFKSRTLIECGEKHIVAKSVLNVMAAGIKCGTEITVACDGPDEEEIRYSVAQVKEACKKLPAGYRVILSLYLFEGYDMEEIASILKIRPSSVRSQYLRAKRKLLDIIAANKENG